MGDWEKCVEFHGHSCGGLRIGYRACLNISIFTSEAVVILYFSKC